MRQRLFGAVVGALVIVGAFASVSSAAAASFQFEGNSAFVKTSQVTVTTFATPAGAYKCSESASSQEIPKPSVETLTLSPSISCPGGASKSWVMNGCTEKITTVSTGSGILAFSCPEGQQISAYVNGCLLTIPAQTPASQTVSFVNKGSGTTRSVEVKYSITGLTYTSPGGACPSKGVHSDGTFTGTMSLKAYKNSAGTIQQGVWVQ
ncbi:MAG TPA: hypothetical protein VD761_02365 [Solirubrobacterales bacterium]|nr:hypothetical protein [Solirubrobacterales bacterium]